MARRTTPHSTSHDAVTSSCGPKTALAWRDERERRRGQEPDSTCVTDLSIWLAKRSEQLGEARLSQEFSGVWSCSPKASFMSVHSIDCHTPHSTCESRAEGAMRNSLLIHHSSALHDSLPYSNNHKHPSHPVL